MTAKQYHAKALRKLGVSAKAIKYATRFADSLSPDGSKILDTELSPADGKKFMALITKLQVATDRNKGLADDWMDLANKMAERN